jgi:hypothetical protein
VVDGEVKGWSSHPNVAKSATLGWAARPTPPRYNLSSNIAVPDFFVSFEGCSSPVCLHVRLPMSPGTLVFRLQCPS